MGILQEQFEEQRRIAEEFCFLNRLHYSAFKEFLLQSEKRQILIKDWDAEIITQVLNSKKSIHGFGNSKSFLTAFCKFAGYDYISEIVSQIKYVNTVRYYLTFSIMRADIQKNISEINPYDIRQYDNIVIVACLVAMGLTPKEIAELKRSDYQNGIIRIDKKTYTCPDDVVKLLNIYDLTDSYVVQCTNKSKTINYRDTEYFIKSTAKSNMSLQTVYLYTKKIPIICDGRGFYEIQQSKAMWDLFLEYGYDLENPNVMRDTDWESVKEKAQTRIPVVGANIDASARNAFLDALIQYRNSIN